MAIPYDSPGSSITRYQPLRAFRRDFDRLFEDFLPMLHDDEDPVATWMPRLDLTEIEEAFTARLDLPGLKREDIQVDVQNNRLTVRGERKAETRSEKENVVRVERHYGTFLRTLTLPENVRMDEIAATFEDGVLTLQIPKAEESKPHRIEVRPARTLTMN